MVYLLEKTLIQGKNIILNQLLVLSGNKQVKGSLRLINKSNIDSINALLYISLFWRINVNNINLFTLSLQYKAIEYLFRERMHLLKSNNIIKLNFSFSFAIRFAFTNLSFLRAKNWLFFKIIILSIYILMILNGIPIVIIKKQRLNINIIIKSFSLQCLL